MPGDIERPGGNSFETLRVFNFRIRRREKFEIRGVLGVLRYAAVIGI